MKSLAFDVWDGGRLTVNREFVPLLRQNGLTTFDALMNFSGGQVAKNVLRERTTTRIDLPDESGEPRSFFLKRHERPPLWEFVKPWLRLQRPLHGARNEWDAILRFHQAGIATMVPAVLGESQGRSFLLTAAIEGCRKLTEWMAEHHGAPAQRPVTDAAADYRRRRRRGPHDARSGSASPGLLSYALDGSVRCD